MLETCGSLCCDVGKVRYDNQLVVRDVASLRWLVACLALWRPGFDPRALWWRKWKWERFSSYYLGFPLSVSYHLCSIFMFVSYTTHDIISATDSRYGMPLLSRLRRILLVLNENCTLRIFDQSRHLLHTWICLNLNMNFFFLIFCWPCISIYLFININQLDAQNFIVSLF